MKTLITLFMLVFLFLQVKAQEVENPCPCCGEQYRQFDFWVGDWNTYGPKGKLVGSNNIVLMQDKCIIQENWKSAGGPYAGTSYNYYDASTEQWSQTWVDNQGGSLQLKGGLEDGSMVLKSDPDPQPEGGSNLNRITWTPNDDGSVRQHWELSKDFGTTWTTLFDGLYMKKESDN